MAELQLEANEKGFTLLESILVLAIVSIMGLILITNMVPTYNKKVLDTFIDQLEKDIMYTQQYALVNKETSFMMFEPNERRYMVGVYGQSEVLLERKYHTDIEIQASYFSNRIIYNPNGSIKKSGSMYFTYQNQSFKVVFYLGKGRFIIQKL